MTPEQNLRYKNKDIQFRVNIIRFMISFYESRNSKDETKFKDNMEYELEELEKLKEQYPEYFI